MKAIIFSRKAVKSESLLLRTISEENQLLTLRIPGVLKSNKRNSFFLYPGSIVDFTIAGPLKDVNIPKETDLIHSPLSTDSSYHELEMLADFLSSLKYLYPDQEYHDIYSVAEKILSTWSWCSEELKIEFTNFFHLYFLQMNGFIGLEFRCTICDTELTKKDWYLPREGELCRNCAASNVEFKSNLIPHGWMDFYLNKFFPLFSENITEPIKKAVNMQAIISDFDYNALYENDTFRNSGEYREKFTDEFLKGTG